MTSRVSRSVLLLGLASGSSLLWASEPAGHVGLGATHDAVIAAYGRPLGQSKSGSKEVLSYPNGHITLEEGKVARLDFRGSGPPLQSVSPVAVRATQPVSTIVQPRKEGWFTDYDDAAREAVRCGQPILAWFSGSGWSSASRQFEAEVAMRPEFSAGLGRSFVFLRIDLPEHTADQAASHSANFRLRERMGVTVYPALLMLSATGEKLAKIDVARPRGGELYVSRVIALVREINDLLGLAPLPAIAGAEITTATSRSVAAVTPKDVTLRLLSAGWGVISAVGSGLLVTGGLLWLLYRNWSGPGPSPRKSTSMADRISEAASGLPASHEITTWSKERIVVMAAGLGEAEGYKAEFQRAGSDKDVVFRKSGEPEASIYVCCAGGNAGVIPAKRIRELVGLLTADGVKQGWFIAPMGFAAEARAYAEKHGVKLIDCQRLVGLLHELPPVAIPSVTRQPWARA